VVVVVVVVGAVDVVVVEAPALPVIDKPVLATKTVTTTQKNDRMDVLPGRIFNECAFVTAGCENLPMTPPPTLRERGRYKTGAPTDPVRRPG
jgi:hypothetical protein